MVEPQSLGFWRRQDRAVTDGLRINGTLVIRQVGPFYLPLLKQTQTDDESANRLARIGRLLTGGDIYSALIYASTTRWSPFDGGSQIYAKANFNPFEARDYRGWWTRFDSDPGSADVKITEVGYNGFFHDVFVDKFIDDLRKVGATAEKNITVVGIPGVSSIPDIIALPVYRSEIAVSGAGCRQAVSSSGSR